MGPPNKNRDLGRRRKCQVRAPRTSLSPLPRCLGGEALIFLIRVELTEVTPQACFPLDRFLKSSKREDVAGWHVDPWALRDSQPSALKVTLVAAET